MSKLASLVETTKLEQALGISANQYEFLKQVPAPQLRALREALNERLFLHDLKLFRRIAGLLRLLPAWLTAFLAHHLFGPLLTARVAGVIQARRAARIVKRLPPDFLAEACAHLDPRCARDLIRLLADEQIVSIALALVKRGDFLTMGRFVDVLRDETIRAVLAALPDEETLLRVAYFMESRNRLDHVVHMMPDERLRKTFLLVLDPSRQIMTEVMFLVAHVSCALQRELGDLAAEQDEGVLARIIHAAQEQGFWADLLPVIATMSESSQRKVVNLPILKQEPAVLEQVFRSADEHDLWITVLPLVRLMDDELRSMVAGIAMRMPHASYERAATAALIGEHWDAVLDVVSRMPESRQVEVAGVIRGYGDVDPELLNRIVKLGRELGVSEAAEAAATV